MFASRVHFRFKYRINLSKMLVWMIVFCNYSMKCFVRTSSAANNDAFWCSSSVHIRKYTWLIAKNIPKNIPHLYVNIFLFTNNRKFYIYGKRKYCLIMMSEHPWFYGNYPTLKNKLKVNKNFFFLIKIYTFCWIKIKQHINTQ